MGFNLKFEPDIVNLYIWTAQIIIFLRINAYAASSIPPTAGFPDDFRVAVRKGFLTAHETTSLSFPKSLIGNPGNGEGGL